MTIGENPGGAKRLRRAIAGFSQRTFQTPMDRLPGFVDALLGGEPPIVGATAMVTQVVFEPRHLGKILTDHMLPLEYSGDRSIVATGPAESAALLTAALGDVIEYQITSPRRASVLAA